MMSDLAAYRLYARIGEHHSRLKEARRIIAVNPGYAVSTSWGKDSLALLSIAVEVQPDVTVINIRYPNPVERFADMDRVRDQVLSRPDMAKIQYVEISCPGEWEMYERVGHGFADATTPEERAAVRWWRAQLDEAAAKGLAATNSVGVFLGLRASESKGRRMNVASRGLAYQRQDGARVALPIGRWNARDVWARIVAHDLPWLRIYDTAGCGRERARSGFVFATGAAGTLARYGVWDDWRRAYPTEFDSWMQRFPGLQICP